MRNVEIPLPEITGTTVEEQLRQIRAYLLELAQSVQEAVDAERPQ